MTNTPEALPSDLSTAHRLFLAERAARMDSEARATQLFDLQPQPRNQRLGARCGRVSVGEVGFRPRRARGQHQPLNRQSERYACEGIDLSLSTLADQVGACAAALRPLHALINSEVWVTNVGDDE